MARVLVAEDDPAMRRLVVEALRMDGHDVLEAADGAGMLVRIAAAFDALSLRVSIDLVVSDMRMPLRNGLDLLERLAGWRWSVPCIVMTAFADDEVRQRTERIGAVLLDKPLDMAALRRAVTRLLSVPGAPAG
jgi:CheY-like chemotaxis protein